MKPVLILTTVDDPERASKISETLVEENLAACVTQLPRVQSCYRWKESVVHDQEILLLIKTSANLGEMVYTRIRELHPYEVPELITINALSAEQTYLEWLVNAVRHE